MMKFLITVTLSFVLVLALGTPSSANNRPCMPAQNPDGYANFLHNHILPAKFSTTSNDAWRRHIRRIGRCDFSQSFIRNKDQKKVEQICNGRGKTLAGHLYAGHLCISDFKIRVFHVQVDANCQFRKVTPKTQPVIVACDILLNRCLPVHYERYRHQQPGNIVCQP